MQKKGSVFSVCVFGAVLFMVSLFQGRDVEDAVHQIDFVDDDSREAAEQMDDIYAVGENIAISDQEIQQYADFYRKNGLDEKAACEAAQKNGMRYMWRP